MMRTDLASMTAHPSPGGLLRLGCGIALFCGVWCCAVVHVWCCWGGPRRIGDTMNSTELLALADRFTGGTRHEDETTFRIDHSTNIGHFYTGSQVNARRLLRRVAQYRADSVTEVRVVKADGEADGLFLSMRLDSLRSVDTLVRTGGKPKGAA